MFTSINHNSMAANTARNLNTHYSNLATSTRRLSSGLRINSAADDAAGLAIRELQRADIAALHQGMRNANDAISLIQVADGALSIIDEKLIRMKELAEQAATGTYNSTQRMMIESEYQAMASEITRIANATDFNGIKLLNGSLRGEHDGSGIDARGKLKVHFGSGNDSAEDYYYLEIGEATSAALGIGNASTWADVQGRAVEAFKESLEKQIKNNTTLSEADKAALRAAIDADAQILDASISNAVEPQNAWKYWFGAYDKGFLPEGKSVPNATMDILVGEVDANAKRLMNGLVKEIDQYRNILQPGQTIGNKKDANGDLIADVNWDDKYRNPMLDDAEAYAKANGLDVDIVRGQVQYEMSRYPIVGFDPKPYERFIVGLEQTIEHVAANPGILVEMEHASIMPAWNSLRETQREKLRYAWGQAALYNLANADPNRADAGYGIGANAFGFANAIADTNTAQAMLDQALDDMYEKVRQMDFAGFTIETQEDAQKSLEAIEKAIVYKDKIRAHLGASQNRLENTVSNLAIQAENLQAAESRISDIDVAAEMTNFIRNQILTQSAVAMLSQANSLPQMAMQLIGG